MTATQHHDPRAAIRFRDFRLLIAATSLAAISQQMLGVAIGWELYERTDSAFALGLVGLVQIVPVILLSLPAGHVADRYNRKWLGVAAIALLALCAGGFAVVSWKTAPVPLVYLVLLFMGIARSFENPAVSSLVAQVVPPAHFENAMAWDSSAWQASSIVGPALGGLLIAWRNHAATVYLIAMVGFVLVAFLLAGLRPRPVPVVEEQATRESLLAGAKFIWRTKVVLAAITLDLFAVLFGGVTALLPVFAKDILEVGPTGLGLMRAASAAGAITAGLTLAHTPPFQHAGRVLLGVVAGFGVASIVFGLSTSFVLSLVMLGMMGAMDNVSVVIRGTLMLGWTPDELRGRVNAVQFVFIGMSNELGAFESGVAAALLGAVGAVVAGGIGTLLVVPAIALAWPEIRRLRRLDGGVVLATSDPPAQIALAEAD